MVTALGIARVMGAINFFINQLYFSGGINMENERLQKGLETIN